MFIYFLAGGGAERGRQKDPSWLHTVSTEPDAGLELMNHEIMTGVEVRQFKVRHFRLSHPGAPDHSISLHKKLPLSFFFYPSLPPSFPSFFPSPTPFPPSLSLSLLSLSLFMIAA